MTLRTLIVDDEPIARKVYVYAFFKHEETPAGAVYAEELLQNE